MVELLNRVLEEGQSPVKPACGVASAVGTDVAAGGTGAAGALGAVGLALAALLAIFLAVRRIVRRRSSRAQSGARALAIVPATSFTWLLESCPDAIVLTDLRGQILRANEPFVELFGEDARRGGAMTNVGALGSRIADREEFESTVRGLYQHPDQHGVGELTYFGRALRVIEWVSEPILDIHEGSVVGRGFLFHDCTKERELAALKSDFLSTVTHELRTPLTSVKGSLQLVLRNGTGISGINRELLDISLKNTDRLIRLINDILDVSQLELGKMDLVFTAMSPSHLIEEAVAGLRAYASGRDVTIGVEVDSDLPAIEGDHDRLIQVLTNLISNAVKFSASGGRVLVSGKATEAGVTIAVRDWGIGISDTDQARLFRRFQRIKQEGSDEPGTGLGLAISKAIVDRHGGRIRVESREAEGSIFTVFLPLSVDGERHKTPADNGAPSGDTSARPTVLLVDDDADLGTVLDVSLGGAYRLLRVESGVQALDVARAERPDLVLLDVVLPDIGGYDVLRILRHSDATRGIPVLILTVRPDRELARSLGAADVVAKPVGIDELKLAIERALRKRSQEIGLRIAIGPLEARAADPLVSALKAAGHTVFLASDLWDLLRLADGRDLDVLVVEAKKPSGGDEAVAFLRGHGSARRLPVVLLTDARECGPVGDDCISIEPDACDEDLVRVIERAVHQQRATSHNLNENNTSYRARMVPVHRPTP